MNMAFLNGTDSIFHKAAHCWRANERARAATRQLCKAKARTRAYFRKLDRAGLAITLGRVPDGRA